MRLLSINEEIINKKEVEIGNWYAIYTNPRAEKKVYERLIDEGFEAFLPLETVYRKWSDRKKKVIVPMIKSYVFVKVEEKDIYKKVLKVFGTVRVLKYLKKPAIIKDYEINNLRILSENGANLVDIASDVKIEVGQNIEIESGPFSGFKCKCARLNGKKGIVVEFESFLSISEVEIPLVNIKC